MDDEGAQVIHRIGRVFAAATLAVVLAAHVGSPDVFFRGRAGPYDIRVVVRPPAVVPGIAHVTVHAPAGVQAVSIRPVYWRAGSKGAPSADALRQLDSESFAGSVWLMARGAYSVDVVVDGPQGRGTVLVPVAAVATGRLALNPALAAILVVLGIVLCAGLVTIVYKAAGESLVDDAGAMDASRRAGARKVAAIAVPVLALALFGGSRWWRAVDDDYQSTIYRPSPLHVALAGDTLRLHATDSVFAIGRVSPLIPDHGKLMHLFLVRANDARAFAHLHPVATDSSAMPEFHTLLPPLPSGSYHVYADVVHETGFERTLVGRIAIADSSRTRRRWTPSDADDAWFAGDASNDASAVLADSSVMRLEIAPAGTITARRELTLRLRVFDRTGAPVSPEPYLGMQAHAVVARLDGSVYVHLHPTGTATMAARDAFVARDRGDTTDAGRIRAGHDMHVMPADTASVIEFPYAFSEPGSYRLFVQVKRNARVLTGAFAVSVASAIPEERR